MSGSKSSLNNHRFPLFYACYLLKSVRTPKSTSTYIGSTPNPPRRIRQHNGEISQGAWKTRNGRPWVMQMIVHGFPSRLAALQFEWAWQHPHLSRHLRTTDGKQVYAVWKRAATMKANVSVVRRMVATHPYSSWPLHVTLFTPAAVKMWNDASKGVNLELPLPPAFRENIVLEGVDGKAGFSCEDWRGPIDVTDATFASLHLAKHTKLLSLALSHTCTICRSAINVASSDTLSLALCPTHSCTGVSHLHCLSSDFLSTERSSTFLPRGGTCKSCNEYVLWGDVVRGSYRRHAGKVASEADVDADMALGLPGEKEVDGAGGAGMEAGWPKKLSGRKKKVKSTPKGAVASGKKQLELIYESERETFDLNAISEDSDSGSDHDTGAEARAGPSKFADSGPILMIKKRPRGRPKGTTTELDTVPSSVAAVAGTRSTVQPVPTMGVINSEFITNHLDTPPKKRRGRPPKSVPPKQSKATVGGGELSSCLDRSVAETPVSAPKPSVIAAKRRTGTTSSKTGAKVKIPPRGPIVSSSQIANSDSSAGRVDEEDDDLMDLYLSDTDRSANNVCVPSMSRHGVGAATTGVVEDTAAKVTEKACEVSGATIPAPPELNLDISIHVPRTPPRKLTQLRAFAFADIKDKDADSLTSYSDDLDFSPPTTTKLLRAMSTLSVSSPPQSPSTAHVRRRTEASKHSRDAVTTLSDDDVIVLSD